MTKQNVNFYLNLYFIISILHHIMKEERISKTLLIGDFHFGTKTNSIQWLEIMLDYLDKQIYKNISSEENLFQPDNSVSNCEQQ